MEKLLLVSDVAQRLKTELGDSRNTWARHKHVHDARKAGMFPGAQKSGSGTNPWQFPESDVDAWFEMASGDDFPPRHKEKPNAHNGDAQEIESE